MVSGVKGSPQGCRAQRDAEHPWGRRGGPVACAARPEVSGGAAASFCAVGPAQRAGHVIGPRLPGPGRTGTRRRRRRAGRRTAQGHRAVAGCRRRGGRRTLPAIRRGGQGRGPATQPGTAAARRARPRHRRRARLPQVGQVLEGGEDSCSPAMPPTVAGGSSCSVGDRPQAAAWVGRPVVGRGRP